MSNTWSRASVRATWPILVSKLDVMFRSRGALSGLCLRDCARLTAPSSWMSLYATLSLFRSSCDSRKLLAIQIMPLSLREFPRRSSSLIVVLYMMSCPICSAFSPLLHQASFRTSTFMSCLSTSTIDATPACPIGFWLRSSFLRSPCPLSPDANAMAPGASSEAAEQSRLTRFLAFSSAVPSLKAPPSPHSFMLRLSVSSVEHALTKSEMAPMASGEMLTLASSSTLRLAPCRCLSASQTAMTPSSPSELPDRTSSSIDAFSLSADARDWPSSM